MSGITNVLGELSLREKHTLRFKKTHPDAITPTRGTEFSAGIDLYSTDEYLIDSECSKMVDTGIAAEIPEGYVGLLNIRSSLGAKRNLRLANCQGIIDSDYRGSIQCAIYNDSVEPAIIHKGDKIAQLVVVPYLYLDPIEVDELDETVRGEGGFGSTGER